MRDGMASVQTFTSELEGAMALARLRALGMDAWLETDNCGGMRPHLDLQESVRLLVAGAELDRARDILAAADAGPVNPAWVCGRCGEHIEAGFDTCWQCGHQN